jgi:hypothetical protein
VAVTNWMKDNADVLGVEYLIWQGKIWSLARDAEGWRPYNGGGMHDPASITGGHYDHLHVTVKAGCVMDVFPDFDGLGGIGDLRAVVGALLMFVLIVAVLMLIVSAIIWAIAPRTATTPPPQGRTGCSSRAPPPSPVPVSRG